jgi:hypothetical protein
MVPADVLIAPFQSINLKIAGLLPTRVVKALVFYVSYNISLISLHGFSLSLVQYNIPCLFV